MERYRAIIVKNGRIALMERHKNGNHFYVLPGGKREEFETEKECCQREVFEEFGIVVQAKNMIYEILQNETKQGFFVCDWVAGEIHKTEAEEYTKKDVSIYGTYNPNMFHIDNLESYNILPPEIKQQLIEDFKQYGEDLNERPPIKIVCKNY